jgi:hypothetical protein
MLSSQQMQTEQRLQDLVNFLKDIEKELITFIKNNNFFLICAVL